MTDQGELHRFSVERAAEQRDVPLTAVHMEAADHRGYGRADASAQ